MGLPGTGIYLVSNLASALVCFVMRTKETKKITENVNGKI